jgi:predicted nuclease of restriction endonuclease-like (RecB) superfamily/predicted transcriptional regulator
VESSLPTLSAKVPAELFDRLRKAVDRNERSMSWIIRQALANYLDEDEVRCRGTLKGPAGSGIGLTRESDAQPTGHTDWLATIKTRIMATRQRAVLAANVELIQLYGQIGREILERQAQQGNGAEVIDRLACELHAAFPGMRGFSPANLKYMCAFAEAWDAEIGQHPVGHLPWGHNVLLLTKLKDPTERLRYAEQAIVGGWSRSTLEANLRDKLLDRGKEDP